MIDETGAFRYTVPTDAKGLVETGVWLRARAYRRLGLMLGLGALCLVIGLLVPSWPAAIVGLVLVAEGPYLLARGLRRARTAQQDQFGSAWSIAFSARGVDVETVHVSSAFAWPYFAAWTFHRGELLLVHAGLAQRFVAVPIAVVPEDEWQALTTLVYEHLGPARKPESVRGSRLRPRPSSKPGEASALSS